MSAQSTWPRARSPASSTSAGRCPSPTAAPPDGTTPGRVDIAFAAQMGPGRMFATLGVMSTTSPAPGAPYVDPYLPEELEVIKPTGGLNGFVPVR